MPDCPVCYGRGNKSFLGERKGYKLYLCADCEVVFADPLRNPGHEWYEGSEQYAWGRLMDVRPAWHHLQFLRDPPTGPKLLDVGCGTGVFLNEARALGYQVTGVDFDRESIRVARERYNLQDVHALTLGEFAERYPERRYNVVTFFEVLEHLDDPQEFIRQVRDRLLPGGCIALSVPNRERLLDTLGEGDFPPNHLTRWNARALGRFLEGAGFAVEKLVIKKLDAADVAMFLKAKIRFGIARSVVQKGIVSGNRRAVDKAAGLMRAKDLLFSLATLPLAPLLKPFRLPGTGLYCLARLRGV